MGTWKHGLWLLLCAGLVGGLLTAFHLPFMAAHRRRSRKALPSETVGAAER